MLNHVEISLALVSGSVCAINKSILKIVFWGIPGAQRRKDFIRFLDSSASRLCAFKRAARKRRNRWNARCVRRSSWDAWWRVKGKLATMRVAFHYEIFSLCSLKKFSRLTYVEWNARQRKKKFDWNSKKQSKLWQSSQPSFQLRLKHIRFQARTRVKRLNFNEFNELNLRVNRMKQQKQIVPNNLSHNLYSIWCILCPFLPLLRNQFVTLSRRKAEWIKQFCKEMSLAKTCRQ